MYRNLLLASTILLAAVFVAPAADLTGKWVAEVAGRGGAGSAEITFEFQVEGKKLTGTVGGDAMAQGRGGGGRRGGGGGGDVVDPSAPSDRHISDGKIDGAKVSFNVKIDRGGQTYVTSFKGTFTDDEMKLKMTRQTRGGDTTTDLVAKRASS
jgi:hypothetical protein